MFGVLSCSKPWPSSHGSTLALSRSLSLPLCCRFLPPDLANPSTGSGGLMCLSRRHLAPSTLPQLLVPSRATANRHRSWSQNTPPNRDPTARPLVISTLVPSFLDRHHHSFAFLFLFVNLGIDWHFASIVSLFVVLIGWDNQRRSVPRPWHLELDDLVFATLGHSHILRAFAGHHHPSWLDGKVQGPDGITHVLTARPSERLLAYANETKPDESRRGLRDIGHGTEGPAGCAIELFVRWAPAK